MKHLSITLACLLTAGCANWGYNPSYRFNEVLAVNLAGATIREVSITIVGSKKSFACDAVNAHAMCRDYFGSRRYPNAGIELNWTQPDGQTKSATVNPDIPVYFPPAFPLRIVLEINPDGSVKSYYEQEEPGDGIYLSREAAAGAASAA